MQTRFSINSIITLFILVIILICYLMFSSCRSVGTFLGKKADRSAQRHLAAAKRYMPFDVLIVPGVPFENGKWDRVMKARVIWSWILYKNGYVRNIIYSGDAVYSPYKEARIMCLYAQKLGIPEEHIFYDTQARHSTENIYYSYLIAKQQKFKTIALGTDPYVQSPLLKSYTKKRFGTYIHHLPFIVDSLRKYEDQDPIIDPVSAAVNDFKSIIQEENFSTRFRGTLGKDIDWNQYEEGRLSPL